MEGLKLPSPCSWGSPGTGKSPAGTKLTELASCHPLLHPLCRGWGGWAGCSQRASTRAKALRTTPAARGGPVSCLPSWLYWPSPFIHTCMPVSSRSTQDQRGYRVGCCVLRWGWQETKAGRKELSPRLPLTQGWHSSFASRVLRRPGVSWRYTLLRLAPNSYQPKEKKAGQKRFFLNAEERRDLNFISCHCGDRLWIFLLLNERTQKENVGT